MITVVVKEPGKDPTTQLFNGDVESVQEIVGGYFEAHRLGPLTLYCNEGSFGQVLNLSPNIMDYCHPGQVIVGTVLVMDGDYGLRPDQAMWAIHTLKQHDVLGTDG